METTSAMTSVTTSVMTPASPSVKTATATSGASMGLDPVDEDIVRAVLTLPGIVGLAFLDRAIPLQVPLQVYGWDAGLEIRQSGVFVASVTQVLRSMPSEFYQLEFGFGSYWVALRRFVTGDAVAFVMRADVDLSLEEVRVAAFCRVAMERRSDVLAMAEAYQQWMLGDGGGASGVARTVLLDAVNRLVEIAGRYLGATIAVRHLTRSRPLVECLAGVTIERNGTLDMAIGPLDAAALTPDQFAAFSVWIQTFVKQCSRIIRNFDVLARKEGLTEEESTLLFGSDP